MRDKRKETKKNVAERHGHRRRNHRKRLANMMK
jgi:hypothetical protein